jgi:outer membrane protein assembly factor BamB
LLFSFDAQSLDQQAVWAVTPSGSQGGIWMGGAIPSVDDSGNIYVATGNGTFDGTSNFGEAVVKLSPQLQVLDYFAPYNYAAYNSKNIDLGSGNAMLVRDQNGPYPHEVIMCGKPSPIYVLNRDNLGGVGTTSDNVVQSLDMAVGRLGPGTSTLYACYSSPAMWKQNVYFVGKYDVLKMFTLDPSTGMLSSSPASQDDLVYGYPGSEPVVSANGTSDGIVWTIDTGTNTLRANDANDVSSLLFSGALSGGTIRWTVPTVANGHVYAGGKGMVFGFSLH